MAEFLVAARDLDTGYKKGDPIVVKPDGWVWGNAEGLPNFWQIAISGLPFALVQSLILPLWEPAIAGDEEFEAEEADRRILRHRRNFRVMWDEVPQSVLDQLETTGRLEIQKNQIRPFVRRLRYNRGQGLVEKTDVRVL